jgi:hypothetical protein
MREMERRASGESLSGYLRACGSPAASVGSVSVEEFDALHMDPAGLQPFMSSTAEATDPALQKLLDAKSEHIGLRFPQSLDAANRDDHVHRLEVLPHRLIV